MRTPDAKLPAARPLVQGLMASRIRELYNAGIGKPDILPFWVGEPDEPTPDFVRSAAIESIERGELTYNHNLGIEELRADLAAYLSRLHAPIGIERLAITSAGVNALMLAAQLVVDPGDQVVEVVPLWPNVQEIPRILGARLETLSLDFSPAGWTLDLDRLLAMVTSGTRMLVVNSPNNPTGWTIDREAQRAILDHCRRTGTWILADDAYERLYFGAGGVAPSFFDFAEPGDRLIGASTFSKAWQMTGWRLGWLVTPAELVPDLGKLIEYNTSCAPIFVQRAAQAALAGGEPVIARGRERLRAARDFLLERLAVVDGVVAAPPDGTMYAFFRIAGMADSLETCKRLVARTALGLAPGSAFGPHGEGCVRWCFAASQDKLADGVERLRRGIAQGCVA